jgi:hypothetical protein
MAECHSGAEINNLIGGLGFIAHISLFSDGTPITKLTSIKFLVFFVYRVSCAF